MAGILPEIEGILTAGTAQQERAMVIGLFSTATDAALCLDNLAEADFPPRSISLVMQTKEDVEAIADVSGPLNELPVDKLTKTLVRLGLSPQEAAAYRDGVLKGGVFIAIAAGAAEAAAVEMLHDGRAQQVRVARDP